MLDRYDLMFKELSDFLEYYNESKGTSYTTHLIPSDVLAYFMNNYKGPEPEYHLYSDMSHINKMFHGVYRNKEEMEKYYTMKQLEGMVDYYKDQSLLANTIEERELSEDEIMYRIKDFDLQRNQLITDVTNFLVSKEVAYMESKRGDTVETISGPDISFDSTISSILSKSISDIKITNTSLILEINESKEVVTFIFKNSK